MNDHILGSCSRCGGAVAVPGVWLGIIPPTPTCNRCGARAAQHGPVIEMEPLSQELPSYVTTTTVATNTLRVKG